MSPAEILLASARRELALRKQVYWARVNSKKMSADLARHEIRCMEQIVEILRVIAECGRYPRPKQLDLELLEGQ